VGSACSTNGKKRNVIGGEARKKETTGRQGRRWVDNIIMDLRSIEWDVMDWIVLTQDRDQWWAFVNTVMNLWVP
jgi:hypothetical protein